MLPRRIMPIEKEYKRHFPDSLATIFTPDYGKEQQRFFDLLRRAIERQAPVTKQEMRDFFTEEDFEFKVDFLSECYGLPKEKILAGLA